MSAQALHLIVSVELCLKPILSALHAPYSHGHEYRDRAKCHQKSGKECIIRWLGVAVVLLFNIINNFFFLFLLWLLRWVVIWLSRIDGIGLVLAGIDRCNGVNRGSGGCGSSHLCPIALQAHDLLIVVYAQIEVLEEGIPKHEGFLGEAWVMHH